ncbi:peptidoglycan-binding protein [Clostridium sp. E02]|uniref:peptidoglycan-binding protein n=1 Tax=Clostridium sp. E02 TaxID=2487134 RepID=UPI000F51CF6D|nr:peptidoglycan-binding protein [Clostridium sp. E02]
MLLVEGSRGNTVKYLQYGLRIKCFNPKSMDGIFGPATTTAVKRYQTSKGLSADGKVGNGTWNALKEDISPIQKALKKKGYYSGTVDGIAGTGTYNALVTFQKEHHLTEDGMAGKSTLNELYSNSEESYPTLKQGSSGSKVKELQKKLIALGYKCGNTGADGSFGAGTSNAVIAFQRANGLTADGIVGKKTWQVLNSGEAIDYDSSKYPLLKQGSKGTPVVRLQNLLIDLKYNCGSTGADGDFGSGTVKAVKEFQTANGLSADGIVGKKTWEVLYSENAVPNPNTTPTLKKGDKGEYVKKLQTVLIKLGYNCGSTGADGAFGSGTYDAVVLFQKKNGLTPDGIVGKKTWEALTSDSAVKNDTTSNILKIGSKGELVEKLQSRLIELKYNCGSTGADGIFGNGTYRAVINFQRINGLSVDGIVGSETWEVLESESAMPYDGSGQTSEPGTLHGNSESCREAIIEEAKYWIGKIPYCINTIITTMVLDKKNPPPYMDCSDFTSSVYLTVLGINIGGTTKVQIDRGTKVSYEDMKPGDLILFDWGGDKKPDHVGLYAGNGQFIDEHGNNPNPNSLDPANQNVRISSIADYKTNILDIRRIIQDDNTIINNSGEVIPIPNDDNKEGEILYVKYDISLKSALEIEMTKRPQYDAGNKWLDASNNQVLKYLDPKNYCTGDSLYQFLDLSAVANLSVDELNDFLSDKGILSGMAKVYIEAANTYHISEVYLAAHSSLETRKGTSQLATGVVVQGKTVYNMYGIGAVDSDPVGQGSKTAYNKGWFTPEAAISGGAKWIASQYINNSYLQNTLYKMRWNPASTGTHQYATDVRWAISQISSYKPLYDKAANPFLRFEIPVYK